MLGICYGMQLMCQALGGKVERHDGPRVSAGPKLAIDSAKPEAADLFAGVARETQVWMSHGDQVDRVSDDFVSLAATDTCPLAAVKHRTLPLYGLQFHPEVTHTPKARRCSPTSSRRPAAAPAPGGWATSPSRRSATCASASATTA